MKRKKKYYLSLLLVFFLSCSEGIFNFTEETGTLLINFSSDDSSKELKNIVISMKNITTDDSITKTLNLSDNTAYSTLYRIDAGLWEYTATVNGASSTLAECSGKYQLGNGAVNTLVFTLNSDTEIECEVVENSDAMIKFSSMSAVLTAYHTAGETPESIEPSVFISMRGENFNSYLKTVKITFPDKTFWEESLNNNISLYNLKFEYNSRIMKITRIGYYINGNYTVTLTDENFVELQKSDYCSYNAIENGGFALLNNSNLSGTTIGVSNYDKNGTDNNGYYIVFVSNKSNPSILYKDNNEGYFSVTSVALDSIIAHSLDDGSGQCLINLVTVDSLISDDDLETAYLSSTNTDMSPTGFVDWIIYSFSEKINFIGISSKEKTF